MYIHVCICTYIYIYIYTQIYIQIAPRDMQCKFLNLESLPNWREPAALSHTTHLRNALFEFRSPKVVRGGDFWKISGKSRLSLSHHTGRTHCLSHTHLRNALFELRVPQVVLGGVFWQIGGNQRRIEPVFDAHVLAGYHV